MFLDGAGDDVSNEERRKRDFLWVCVTLVFLYRTHLHVFPLHPGQPPDRHPHRRP